MCVSRIIINACCFASRDYMKISDYPGHLTSNVPYTVYQWSCLQKPKHLWSHALHTHAWPLILMLLCGKVFVMYRSHDGWAGKGVSGFYEYYYTSHPNFNLMMQEMKCAFWYNEKKHEQPIKAKYMGHFSRKSFYLFSLSLII